MTTLHLVHNEVGDICLTFVYCYNLSVPHKMLSRVYRASCLTTKWLSNHRFEDNTQPTIFWHNVHMPHEHMLALRQADQARAEFSPLSKAICNSSWADSRDCRRGAI